MKPATSPCLQAVDNPAFNEQTSPGASKIQFQLPALLQPLIYSFTRLQLQQVLVHRLSAR